MKRELLELKQKLMQRFLDGAIDQETYNRMLTEIESMAQQESESIPETSGPAILNVSGVPRDEIPGVSGTNGAAAGNSQPTLPSFVTILPPGAPMQMSAAYPFPPGAAYPGGQPGYPGNPAGYSGNQPGYPGNPGVPSAYPAYPAYSNYQGMENMMAGNGSGLVIQPNSAAQSIAQTAAQTATPSMMSADKLEVRTSTGVKRPSLWQDEIQINKSAPNPEIDPLVLKALKEGETLEVWWHYELTPQCVEAWKKIDVPLRLSLTMNEAIDDEALRLLGQIPNLHEINLTSTPISDDGLRALGRLTNLESLILTSTEVTGETFGSLENCRNLRELTLTSTPFSNEGMEFLSQFQMLDSLKLDDTNITDEGMNALVGLHQMKLLNLQGTIVSDAGLKCIAHMTSLVELYLGGTIPYDGDDYESPITDKGIESLSELTELRVLHLNDTQVTNACLASMKKMTELYEFNVTDTYFSDDSLKILRRFENLHEVIVDGTLITEAGVRKIFGRNGSEIFHGASTGSWNKLGRFLMAPWSRKN